MHLPYIHEYKTVKANRAPVMDVPVVQLLVARIV